MNPLGSMVRAWQAAWAGSRGSEHSRLPALLALTVQLAQILLGVVSVPLLLQSLGAERYSALSILWVLPALVPLIDIGLPRALASLLVQPRYRAEPCYCGLLLLVAMAIQLFIILALGLLVWLPFGDQLMPGGLDGLAGEPAGAGSLLAKFLTASALLALANLLAAFLQARGHLYALLTVNAFSGLTISAIPLSVLIVVPTIGQIGSYTLWLRLLGLGLSLAIVIAVADGQRLLASWQRLRTMVQDLLAGGARSFWYFAISPLLVFGERYIALYGESREPIASHLIAVDLGLRFLIVPGVMAQYSFRAIADAGGQTRSFDAAVARYMPMMSVLFLLPLLVAIGFARPLLGAWLGPAHVTTTTVVCLQLVLCAVASCAVSSLLVQVTLAANAMQRLSKLVLLELLLYPPLMLLVLWLRPPGVELSLVLSLCWAGRVVVEAVIMTRLTKDLFVRGSLLTFVGMASGACLTVAVLCDLADAWTPALAWTVKSLVFMIATVQLMGWMRRQSERRR